MNTRIKLAALAAGTLLAAGAAQAGVAWSIGIDAPGLATVVSNQPVYRAVPAAYYGAAPVYSPVPVYAVPAPVYAPAPVHYVAPPVRYAAPAVRYVPVPVRHVAPRVRYVPAPVVYEQPSGYYEPPAAYYGPSPVVVVEPGFRIGDWGWRHRHEGRWAYEHDRRDGRR